MDNKTKISLIICAYTENIAIIILAGFLCWYFKTLWGLIPLLFTNTRIRVNQEENKNDE